MLEPGEALARVLATMRLSDRVAFLEHLTREAHASGDQMYLSEIEAYTARQAKTAPGAGDRPPSPKPVLRLVPKE